MERRSFLGRLGLVLVATAAACRDALSPSAWLRKPEPKLFRSLAEVPAGWEAYKVVDGKPVALNEAARLRLEGPAAMAPIWNDCYAYCTAWFCGNGGAAGCAQMNWGCGCFVLDGRGNCVCLCCQS